MNQEAGRWMVGYCSQWSAAWENFWFSKRDPATLGVIRIFVGMIVLYTHLVWFANSADFLGEGSLIPADYRQQMFGSTYAWSIFDWAGTGIWIQVLGLIVVGLFTLGYWTRLTSVMTCIFVISYANRGMGALFGLDQINSFLCLYLAIGNSGAAYSLDAMLRRKPDQTGVGEGTDVWSNIATRLIQVHMCVVYFFAAIGKLQGETWLNGEATWGAMASYEYQTIDMTWLSGQMVVVAILTLGTVFWELLYPALIWPRLTRPIMLAFSIPIHLGIGLCMGMLTFGLIMLAGNFSFVPPSAVRKSLWFLK